MNINLTFINSTFVNLENLDRKFWILTGELITFCSVLINALAIYLIIRKSKKETKAYKVALVASQSLLCLSQFKFGVLLCIVPLFPFPAFKFYGILNDYVDVILLMQVWIVIIASFLWALYATLAIRLRMVVRPDSIFNFPLGIWISVSLTLYIACLISVTILLEILRLPASLVEEFIAWKYPKYKDISKQNVLLFFADKRILHITAFSCIAIAMFLVMLYVILSVLIYVEVKNRVNSMSAGLRSYHIKVLKDIILQIFIKLVTFTFYPILVVLLYFVTPEFDCIHLTMTLYNVFVSAPIPGTIALIIQTPPYRKFILRLFSVKKIEPMVVLTQRSLT